MYAKINPNELNRPGDFTINDIRLVSYQSVDGDNQPKKISIKTLVTEINIYESIFNKHLSGSIILLDAQNLLMKLPITGFERIEFSVHTPSMSKGFDFREKTGHPMYIYAVKNRKNLEQQEVEAYVNKFGIDCILSDHRYGFFSDTTHSIFITHQLNLPVRKLEFLVDQLHLKLMKKFDEVWVMDYANNRLAGKLSKVRKGVSLSYIGPYSRFSIYDKDSLKVGHTVVISSGPLIYAQQFLDQCLLKLDNENTIVVAPKEMNISQDFTHISESWGEQDKVIMAAKKIVSKSGYSTIMDLDYLKTEHQLYTTKGQREQEYLYKVHSNGKKLL